MFAECTSFAVLCGLLCFTECARCHCVCCAVYGRGGCIFTAMIDFLAYFLCVLRCVLVCDICMSLYVLQCCWYVVGVYVCVCVCVLHNMLHYGELTLFVTLPAG